jgi:hypothetical protein
MRKISLRRGLSNALFLLRCRSSAPSSPMKTTSILSALIAGCVFSAVYSNAGEDDPKPKAPFQLKTVSGKVYEKVQVIAQETDGIRIRHADGVAKILLTDLSSADRSAQGYETSNVGALKAVAAGEQQQKADDALTEFTQLHANVLTAFQNSNYDFPQLDTALLRAILRYRKEGKSDWASTLEADRTELARHESRRSRENEARQQREAEAESMRIRQYAAAPTSQRSLTTGHLSTPGLRSPYIYPCYDYYYARPYIYRPTVTRPNNSAYMGSATNGTGAGGYVPADMTGGLDAHGGYTPPAMR